MKKAFLLIIAMLLSIEFSGCRPKRQGDFASGPGDMEPPRFATEQLLAKYLSDLEEDSKTDCYYRLNAVPADMEFDSYSSYFSYVDWWFRDPNVSEEAAFIYLRWYFTGNGQEWLDNDLNENGAGRTELQAGGKTYYYLLVDEADAKWPKLYDILWLQDGYLFGMNMPESYIAPNGGVEEELLLKYTELTRVSISG